MVLRMTGARELSMTMSDTEHVGHVHFLGQQRTQEITEDRIFYTSFSFFLWIDC